MIDEIIRKIREGLYEYSHHAVDQTIVRIISEKEIREALKPYLGKKMIFDLVRIIPSPCHRLENYDGICW